MSELSREYPLTLELPLAAINWTVNSNTADADIQATAHQTPQAMAMKKNKLRFVFVFLFRSIISPLIGGLVFLWHDPYIRFSVSCPVASQCVFIRTNKMTTLGYTIIPSYLFWILLLLWFGFCLRMFCFSKTNTRIYRLRQSQTVDCKVIAIQTCDEWLWPGPSLGILGPVHWICYGAPSTNLIMHFCHI